MINYTKTLFLISLSALLSAYLLVCLSVCLYVRPLKYRFVSYYNTIATDKI